MNHTTAGVPDTQPTIRRWWMVAIACSAIVVAACSGAAAGPTEVVESYIDIYNAGDIDELTEVFAEDAVLSGHPFAPEAEGIDAILSIQQSDRASAAEEAPYEISNVQATDNTVTWDHVWTSSEGEDWCAEGNTAVVEDGKIASWEFAPNPHPCA